MNTEFQQLPTTRKGNAGEAIVKLILERAGWTVYDCKADRPHLIDFFCYKPGKGVIAVDAKTYPRRADYQDTGIDCGDFETYQRFEAAENIPVHLVWIDEIEQAVYGRPLSHLVRHASRAGNKIYFPLTSMRLHRHLFPKELAEIRAVSSTDVDRYQRCEMFFTWSRVQARARG